MHKIPNPRLPAVEATALKAYQMLVDKETNFARKVAEAKRQFALKNTKTNSAFTTIKRVLTDMCGGTRRCMYCEDSAADEVEHFKPKDLYPEAVFSWANYLYACGPCNGPKNNIFSIINRNRNNSLINAMRNPKAAVLPPPRGKPALIDPRHENPLDFLWLDLKDTFEFTPIGVPGTIAHLRAEFTLATLRLNDRDYLVEARRNAFGGYRARLKEYIHSRDRGEKKPRLKLLKDGIKRSPHPTVWAEMIRQYTYHADLLDLFTAAPEALGF